MNNRGKIIIIIIFILGSILLCSGLVISLFGNNSLSVEKKDLSIYSENNLIPFREDFFGKFGYIDSNGKVKIEPQFDSAKSFIGGYAVVEKNMKNYLINSNGIKVMDLGEEAVSFELISWNEKSAFLINNVLYDMKLNRLTDEDDYTYDNVYGFIESIDEINNEYLLMDIEGNILLSSKDDKAIDVFRSFATGRYYGVLEEEKYWKVISLDSKKVVYESNDVVGKVLDIFDYGIVVYSIDQETNSRIVNRMYIGNDDTIVYQGDVEYEFYNESYLRVISNDNGSVVYKYIDVKTNQIKDVVDLKPGKRKNFGYSQYRGYSDKYIYKCDNGKETLVWNDDIVSECEYEVSFDLSLYDYIKEHYNKNIVRFFDGEFVQIYDMSSNKVLNKFDVYDDEEFYKLFHGNSDSSFVSFKNKNGEVVVYNYIKNKFKTFKDAEVFISPNYVEVISDNGSINSYYNMDLDLIKSYEISY